MNDKGNITRPGVVPKFSDLEVIALSLTAETMGIDSECYLFGKLHEYRSQMPNLISRRQFNDRRKLTAGPRDKALSFTVSVYYTLPMQRNSWPQANKN